ncbi:MAG TPA: SHOCT domain-containing protein [Roseomonas sp.]
MNGQGDRHIDAFRKAKLKPGETVEAHLQGWIGEMMGQGKKKQHNGQFVLTSERACFHRKGLFGEIFETIPLSKITSVETKSLLGYRLLRLHTSHDELAFKTFEGKTIFEAAYARLEELRHGSPGVAAAAPAKSVTDQLRKLADLRDAGILTEDEFSAKKTELLARI